MFGSTLSYSCCLRCMWQNKKSIIPMVQHCSQLKQITMIFLPITLPTRWAVNHIASVCFFELKYPGRYTPLPIVFCISDFCPVKCKRDLRPANKSWAWYCVLPGPIFHSFSTWYRAGCPCSPWLNTASWMEKRFLVFFKLNLTHRALNGLRVWFLYHVIRRNIFKHFSSFNDIF